MSSIELLLVALVRRLARLLDRLVDQPACTTYKADKNLELAEALQSKEIGEEPLNHPWWASQWPGLVKPQTQ